ncbi:MAG TPA: glucokinase [Xanthobacteraceae bacterium]|nr:glucokinase [Xanthobacteraceae bacterium]
MIAADGIDKRLPSSLIGDIGGTNARFALVGPDGAFRRGRVLACDDHATLEQAIRRYRDEELEPAGLQRIQAAAIAVAGPVTGDRVTLTNHPWSFSIRELQSALGLDRLVVVNDLAAVALATPRLGPDQLSQVGGGAAAAAAPIGVIAPGSGLGAGAVVPSGGGWRPLPSEGGHVTMAPATLRESAVLDRLRERFDHVSAERVVSGPGLVNLYNTLCELDGAPAASFTAAQITDPGIGMREPHCREAVDMFCAMLGTIAGDLALTLGARGGIHVAGGIVPKLGATFAASGFRSRFEDKGRMRPYLAAIPTWVIIHPYPAFPGLVALLTERICHVDIDRRLPT